MKFWGTAMLLALPALWAGGSEPVSAANSVNMQGASAVSISSMSTASGGSVEAVVSGANAVIDVNNDHVEIDDGRLTLNGVSYGRVDERSTVTYRVSGGEKTLLVDGRVRRPVEDR